MPEVLYQRCSPAEGSRRIDEIVVRQPKYRPTTATLAPGILLLVSGSLGFRSIASLLDNQIVPGVGIAVQMILTAMVLVAGILIANILLPVRRR